MELDEVGKKVPKVETSIGRNTSYIVKLRIIEKVKSRTNHLINLTPARKDSKATAGGGGSSAITADDKKEMAYK